MGFPLSTPLHLFFHLMCLTFKLKVRDHITNRPFPNGQNPPDQICVICILKNLWVARALVR